MRLNYTNILLVLFCLSFMGCNSVKYLSKDKYLLKKNIVKVDGKTVSKKNINPNLYRKTNIKFLGMPLKLYVYNLSKKNPDSVFVDNLKKSPKKKKRLQKIFSQKQVNLIQKSYSGFNKWLKDIGEQPVEVGRLEIEKTAFKLKTFYFNKGYFDTKVYFKVDTLNKNKLKIKVTYDVNRGNRYKLDTIVANIKSKVVDSIYKAHKETLILKYNQYFDLAKIVNERDKLYGIFRNNGIYNFKKNSISYKLTLDTIQKKNVVKLVLEIKNINTIENNTQKKEDYKLFKIKEVNYFIDNFKNNSFENSKKYKGDFFSWHKNYVKPKILSESSLIKKSDFYSDYKRTQSHKNISRFGIFKNPSIEYIKSENDTSLTANVHLFLNDKYSINLDANAFNSALQELGIFGGFSLTSRNVFNGGEILNISPRANIGFQRDADINNLSNLVYQIGGDVILKIPRIITPFTNNSVFKNHNPYTNLSIGTSFQKNIGLDKQSVNLSLNYTWNEERKKKYGLEIFTFQFVNNLNSDNFFNIYKSSYDALNKIAIKNKSLINSTYFYKENLLIPFGVNSLTNDVLDGTINISFEGYKLINSINERKNRLVSNNLISTSSFRFENSNKAFYNDNDFKKIITQIEFSGNFFQLLSNFIDYPKDEFNNNLILEIPYSQYVKMDFNFVKYWELQPNNILAFNFFTGLAVPYGNSNSIPFFKSYFAGGTNDNRGWLSYSLGPGSSNSLKDFNEANFKIATNLEYRFSVLGNLYSAVFVDAGNIFNLWNNIDDPFSMFNGFESLSDLAVSTGIGLRYDFNFLIFRLDLGFKTYNPNNTLKDKWINFFDINKSIINIGINYPF